jgi:hypothetical protein
MFKLITAAYTTSSNGMSNRTTMGAPGSGMGNGGYNSYGSGGAGGPN